MSRREKRKGQVKIPSGTSGEWRVEKFRVTQEKAMVSAMRYAFNPQRTDRRVVEGTYTKLVHETKYEGGSSWGIFMSDTPAEVIDHVHFTRVIRDWPDNHRRSIIIGGLGLGVVLQLLKDQDLLRKLNHIHVVEKERDVIKLVKPAYTGPEWRKAGLRIYHGDVFKWAPPDYMDLRDYSAAWMDIWPTITSCNLPEMEKLRKRYGRWVSSPSQVLCWCEYLCAEQDGL